MGCELAWYWWFLLGVFTGSAAGVGLMCAWFLPRTPAVRPAPSSRPWRTKRADHLFTDDQIALGVESDVRHVKPLTPRIR